MGLDVCYTVQSKNVFVFIMVVIMVGKKLLVFGSSDLARTYVCSKFLLMARVILKFG